MHLVREWRRGSGGGGGGRRGVLLYALPSPHAQPLPLSSPTNHPHTLPNHRPLAQTNYAINKKGVGFVPSSANTDADPAHREFRGSKRPASAVIKQVMRYTHGLSLSLCLSLSLSLFLSHTHAHMHTHSLSHTHMHTCSLSLLDACRSPPSAAALSHSLLTTSRTSSSRPCSPSSRCSPTPTTPPSRRGRGRPRRSARRARASRWTTRRPRASSAGKEEELAWHCLRQPLTYLSSYLSSLLHPWAALSQLPSFSMLRAAWVRHHV
jgi:hypothetical protein